MQFWEQGSFVVENVQRVLDGLSMKDLILPKL